MGGFKETAFPDPIELMCVNPQRLCPQSQDLHRFGPHNSQHWEREWTQSATPNPETICIWNMLEKGKSIFFNGVIGCINHAPGLANTHKFHVCSFVLCTFCFILIVFVLLIFFHSFFVCCDFCFFFLREREHGVGGSGDKESDPQGVGVWGGERIILYCMKGKYKSPETHTSMALQFWYGEDEWKLTTNMYGILWVGMKILCN